MKKSEVIKLLDSEFIWPEGMANQVLNILESVGMKPPCNAGFGGHGILTERGFCDDYIESCSFHWDCE